MFFLKMMLGVYKRQWKKMCMIALTILLGTSVATAMLNVMLDVGDKINTELKSYGANITVVSKSAAVLSNLYEFEDANESDVKDAYVKEEDVSAIKTIFWAYNITDLAPSFETYANVDGTSTKIIGNWFNHKMDLSTGEEVYTGVKSLRSWWEFDKKLNGSNTFLDETVQVQSASYIPCMVGATFAKEHNVSVGDTLTLSGKKAEKKATVYSIYESGDDDDSAIYTYLDTAQSLSNMEGYVRRIEVSAMTNPDDALSARVASKPSDISVESFLGARDYETWYCTAYVSSICYQIQEVIPYVVASAVRQVADSEGEILNKTQLLMTLITVLALIAAALGISNLVTSSVMERSQEIGLMKAVGAKNYQVTLLVIIEIMVIAIIGAIAGYFLGYAFAQIIGQTVFSSSINMNGIVAFVVFVLIILVTLLGSIPAVSYMLRLRPTKVLHGRD